MLAAVLRGGEDALARAKASGLWSELVHLADVAEFVDDYRRRYKAFPAETTVAARVEGWAPVDGALDFWLDELRKATVARKAQAAMLEALEQFDEPESALAQLIVKLGTLRLMGAATVGATDSEILRRYERFEARAEAYEAAGGQAALGLPTGFKPIAASGIGWMPGELIGVFARPATGKTWILAREAVEAWLAGYRVLFLSPEMPRQQLALRFDVLKAARLGIKLSHRMLTVGHPAMRAPYRELAEAVAQRGERWWTVDSDEEGAFTLAKIEVYMQQLLPDIVFIDGASLIATKKREEWQAMKEVMYGLKALATAAGIPIMVSHQSVRRRVGAKDVAGGRGDDWIMPSLADAAFGDAFVQAASTVITMCADRYRADVRWYSVRKVRDREPLPEPRYAMWVDFDHGRIEDLGHLRRQEEILDAVARLSGQAA